jgi:hypothetical protein
MNRTLIRPVIHNDYACSVQLRYYNQGQLVSYLLTVNLMLVSALVNQPYMLDWATRP